MFARSARFYDSLYGFKDYARASEQFLRLIQERHPAASDLLDVACGTGRHLEHFRARFAAPGLDLNPELLAMAHQRCPDVKFHLGDMTDFALGSAFDVVTCLFSAIAYVRSVDNLFRAVAAMARHLRRRGLLLVEPWFTPETYWTDRLTANLVDEPDFKVSWMYVSRVEGRLSVLDIHYQVGTPSGIEQFRERHEMGLFTDAEYRQAFADAGLVVSADPSALFGRALYVGVKGDA